MTTIALGYPDTIQHEATAAAVARVLEANDAEVDFVPGARDVVVAQLRAGEIDMFVSAWLPDIDADLIGGGGDLMALGQLYRPHFTLCVPAVVGDLASIADATPALLSPEIVTPESMVSAVRQAAGAYGLTERGFTLDVRPDEVAYAHAVGVIERGEAALLPLPQPHFLFHDGRITQLADPLGALGREQVAQIVLSRAVRDTLDSDLLDELDELTLGNKVISALDCAMRREGLSAEAAAESWQRGRLLPR
ncbi:glycine/betaine ABC transporter periplasmic protein [Ameyamaea chiangmaiensis NBRC 103196]|uniref:Glycine betaine ABC transporter substrate-binding protein n=1 Tax=Ameyamaea chiangmaiensis TaxID=442969 RepID=A0A850PB98_9PROT|nr:glycine betaine ABC transporter substrate-binding protein [Ameyamaea chiangmaiensis]MBS4075108.1 glycine betaine ABC transporter substrate-binding protein [Ameyamaea chiangmaiensis]NVN41354.1 glycine betaine ABC transporter substrate-binding protein [Ameyamaea chiangmaiensis]GBQ66078.1 glycine/betaine ABC transporter periplasmic protein [Ameyamaea chiangmaiensis NBRC 103196]